MDFLDQYLSNAAFRARFRADVDAALTGKEPDKAKLAQLVQRYGLRLSLSELPQLAARAKKYGLMK